MPQICSLNLSKSSVLHCFNGQLVNDGIRTFKWSRIGRDVVYFLRQFTIKGTARNRAFNKKIGHSKRKKADHKM